MRNNAGATRRKKGGEKMGQTAHFRWAGGEKFDPLQKRKKVSVPIFRGSVAAALLRPRIIAAVPACETAPFRRNAFHRLRSASSRFRLPGRAASPAPPLSPFQ